MGFLGMRGTGDWAADERPKSWREKILELFPNGDMPLTAVMSRMSSRKVDDPEFNWWEKELPAQSGAVTNVYTDSSMDTAYTTGGTAGQTLYVKVAAATIAHFRVGHQVLLRNSANYADDANAKVTGIEANGANSKVTVKLLQADPTTTGIADCDRILIIGSINAEGAAMPDAVAYDPTKRTNYTQIFRTPLSITRTAQQTRLRTGNSYKRAKKEALKLHGIEMEKAFIWGYPLESTGDNGKPERTTGGIIYRVNNFSGIAADFTTETDAAYSGKTWLQAGEEWLDEHFEEIFRYGSDERLALCGATAIRAINKLVKHYGNYQFTARTVDYGIKVMEWVTPFGVVYMKRHPLFSFETTNLKSMLLLDPAMLEYRYLQDTEFYSDAKKQNTGRGRYDSTDEEYLTEAGLELHHAKTFGYLNGLGDDNSGA
jgi:hypothetical protein